MSDITITEKNLSRFNKRLQKSLEKHFSTTVPLHTASQILAQALGLDTVHHLKEKLASENIDECDKITKYINNYLADNLSSKIMGFSFTKEDEYSCFMIRAQTKLNINSAPSRKIDEVAFGIYFGDSAVNYSDSNYISSEMKDFDLTDSDIEFLRGLIKLLHFQDTPRSIFLCEQLKQKFLLDKCKCASFEFKNSTKYVTVSNYGYCESLFALVEDNFFDKLGAEYVFNKEHYAFINLESVSHQFFKSFEDGKHHITDGKMLLEFLTPISQFSTLVKPSTHRKQGICSYYTYKDTHDQIIATTVNNAYSHNIKNLSDYYFFLGKRDFLLGKTKLWESTLAINHRYRKELIEGAQSCHKSNPIPTVKKKK